MHAAERPSCSVLETDAAHSSQKKRLQLNLQKRKHRQFVSEFKTEATFFFLSFAGSLVNQLIAAACWQTEIGFGVAVARPRKQEKMLACKQLEARNNLMAIT